MAKDNGKPGRGRPAKPLADHLHEGTYRADRHGPLCDLSQPLHPKPPHLSESERLRCQIPAQWRRDFEARGTWNANDELALDRGCWFDSRHAEHFRDFCREFLCLWEGRQWAGKPFELMDWQYYDVFARIFGWFRWDEDWNCPVRRFDRCYVEVPKKNGKSPMAAAVGLYFLAADEAMGGKVFSAASAREQANIVHGHAMAMVRASPRLIERCKINRSTNTVLFEPPELWEHADISRPPAQNLYRSISSEAGPQEGRNANAIICDELHVWQGRKLWDALKYAFETRLSPLLFCITTAGDDEQSVCYEQHEYAKAVAAGHVQDIGYLGYVRAAEPNDDAGDEQVWKKANPSLGTTVTISRLRQMYEEASKTNAALSSFKRYRLNIWATVPNPMLDPIAWDACAESFTAEDLEGQPCIGGLDLSKTEDMTALALLFRDGELYRQLVYFWLPEETYRKNRDRCDYDAWIKAGALELCPGPRIDNSYIERKLLWAEETFDLQHVVYDPWRAPALIQRLTGEHGWDEEKCVEMPQTIVRLAAPTAEYETLVMEGRLHHNGNPLLTWQSRHVKTKADANKNERPVKPIRGDIRTIDGIVAGIMALSVAMGEEMESAVEEIVAI